MYACICTYLCMPMCVGMCTCVSMWMNDRPTLDAISQNIIHVVLLRQALSFLSGAHWFDQAFPVLGLQTHATMPVFFLRWVLVWQAPSWLSHLLSYKLYSFYKSALTGWVVVHAFSSSACLGGRGRRSELQARLVFRTVRVAPRSPVSKNLKRGYVFLCVLININIMFAIFWNFFKLCIKVP